MHKNLLQYAEYMHNAVILNKMHLLHKIWICKNTSVPTLLWQHRLFLHKYEKNAQKMQKYLTKIQFYEKNMQKICT